jgi:hypothetical protein
MTMSQLEVAALLAAVVIAVILATRPVPPRRRRARPQRPNDTESGPHDSRTTRRFGRSSPEQIALDAIHRNRWDRADLAAGIGRDDVVADPSLNLWPTTR